MRGLATALALVMTPLLSGCFHGDVVVELVQRIPVLAAEPWQVAGDPDLREFSSPKQQPVDFGIWQADDGAWQLWSCIRGTKCGGTGRLFYRWEGQRLTDPNWTPRGIAMQADQQYGETPGGLQAPFVIRYPGALPESLNAPKSVAGVREPWLMFYGDWVNICMAASADGRNFERWLHDQPTEPRASARAANHARQDLPQRAGMFSEGPEVNTRDAMVLRIGNRWHCYYTAHPGQVGSVFCRTSHDLRAWSDARLVARGGQAGTGISSAECPFVVPLDGYYYLFRTQDYGHNAITRVYRSRDPMDFGVDDDRYLVASLPLAAPEIIRHDGHWYIAHLLPSLKGIQIARLEWQTVAHQ